MAFQKQIRRDSTSRVIKRSFLIERVQGADFGKSNENSGSYQLSPYFPYNFE